MANYALTTLQDVLDLGSEARMNFPGKSSGNWSWRFRWEALREDVLHRLRDVTVLYGRDAPRFSDS